MAHQAGQFDVAKDLYRQVLALHPNNASAQAGLGSVFAQQGKPKKAYPYLHASVSGTDISPDVIVNYGGVCLELKKMSAATKAFTRALKLDSNLGAAHNGLGLICEKSNKLDEAFGHFRQAYSIEPNDSSVRENVERIGLSLVQKYMDLGDNVKASEIMDVGLELTPDFEELQLIKANYLRAQGSIKEGAKLAPKLNAEFKALDIGKWDGHSLPTGRLLVRSEEGIGDQIIFASIIPELSELCPNLTVECDHRLVPIFTRSFPTVEFVGWRDPPLERLFDADITKQITMTDACALRRPDLVSFPAPKPFMVSDTKISHEFRDRYVTGKSKKIIGFSWASSNNPSANNKSIPLPDLIKGISIPETKLLSLQYGDYAKDIEKTEKHFGVEIIQDAELDPIKELDQFAAAVSACDIVITCSNATAHFAGALGVPAWVIIPANPLWRWFLDRTDSLWYSSVRLIRRTHEDKNWKPAIAKTRESVEQWLATSKA